VTLKLTETSVAKKSRPSVPYGANFFGFVDCRIVTITINDSLPRGLHSTDYLLSTMMMLMMMMMMMRMMIMMRMLMVVAVFQ